MWNVHCFYPIVYFPLEPNLIRYRKNIIIIIIINIIIIIIIIINNNNNISLFEQGQCTIKH